MKRIAARASLQLGVQGAFLAASGYVGMLILAWSLGPAQFGLYGVIVSLVVWLERTTMFGIPSATTKLMAEGEETAAPTSMLISVALVMIVTVALWLLAPAMARLFQAPGQAALFRLAALDIPFYGMYLLYRGVAMGHRKFAPVFWSGLILGAAKLIAIVWVVLAGYAISGALVAYVIGSVAGFLFFAICLPLRPAPLDLRVARTLAQMAVPLAISNLGVSIVHSLDLWILKALAAPDMDREVGVYAASRVLARAPELVLLPIGTVLFPLVSRSLAQNDLRQVGVYIKGAMRVLWLVLLPTVALVAIDAEAIMQLLFPASYHGGGSFLTLQVLGFGALTILTILLSVLKARGDFYTTVAIGFAMVVAVLALAFIFVPAFGTIGAAYAFALTVATGALVSGMLVYQRLGVLMSGSMLVKGMVATAVLIPAALVFDANGVWLVPKYAMMALAYGGLLWAQGELRFQDFQGIFSLR